MITFCGLTVLRFFFVEDAFGHFVPSCSAVTILFPFLIYSIGTIVSYLVPVCLSTVRTCTEYSKRTLVSQCMWTR